MREIVISNGMVMKVDDDVYDDMARYKWSYSTHGYAYRKKWDNGERKYESIFAHRYILGLKIGDRIWVDHRNGDKLDVRRENLRVASPTQNNANRASPNVRKISKYKGVSPMPRCSTWRATISINKKQIHIGGFATEEEAALAYNRKAVELFGEFAYLNEVKVDD